MKQEIIQCFFKRSQHGPVISVIKMCVSLMVPLIIIFMSCLSKVSCILIVIVILPSFRTMHSIYKDCFTFMTSSEALGNEKSLWYHSHFRDKTQKVKEDVSSPSRRADKRPRQNLTSCAVSKSRALSTLTEAHITLALSTTQVTPVSCDPEQGQEKIHLRNLSGIYFCHDVISLKKLHSCHQCVCVWVIKLSSFHSPDE